MQFAWGVPTVRDRVVQRAVAMILEPICEEDFEACSYGFRPGRSAHDALRAIQKHLNTGKTAVYDADLAGYLNALRHRGVDVTSSRDRGLLGLTDEDQLAWAAEQRRVLYTYNACDFCRLHSTFLQQGRSHAGIIIGDQQTVSIGGQVRRLLKLTETKTAAEMENHLEFLGNWS